MDVPNLDAMNKEELSRFIHHCDCLSGYARRTLVAMQYREAGEIVTALKNESQAQEFYELLPADWRW